MAAAFPQIPATVSLDGEALTAPAVSPGLWVPVAHGSDMRRGGGVCKFIPVSGGDDFGCQEDARHSSCVTALAGVKGCSGMGGWFMGS